MTVSGPAMLGLGEAGQLSSAVVYATHYDDVRPVVRGVWTSSNPAVVTVDAHGTVTGVAVGSASISLTVGGKTGSLTIPVYATITITACGQFTSGNLFAVANDLATTLAAGCVQFLNLTNAAVDCQGHDISSAYIQGVAGLVMRNCKLHARSIQGLQIRDSTLVTVDATEVWSAVLLQNVQNSAVTNSAFRWSPANVLCGFDSTAITLRGGSGNRFLQDTVDGGWDGNMQTYGHQGCDDGFGLDNEANVTIQNNTIANVYDAGVEPYSPNATPLVVTNATISGNTFTNNGYTAIGDYWGPGWQNSTISGNTSTATPGLIHFSMSPNLKSFTFVNNRITGNVVRGQVPLPPVNGGQMTNPVSIVYLPSDGAVTVGNLIQGNDFGSLLAPLLLPATGFIDGGGNRCVPSFINGLTCATPLPQVLRR